MRSALSLTLPLLATACSANDDTSPGSVTGSSGAGSGGSSGGGGTGGSVAQGGSASGGSSGSATQGGSGGSGAQSGSGGGGAQGGSGGSGAQGGSGTAPTLGGCQLFPADSVWNTPVDSLPIHPLSATYIASIDETKPSGTSSGEPVPIHPDFGSEWNGMDIGISFDIVPSGQPLKPISFLYWDESDLGDTSGCATGGDPATGCYPIPDNPAIEGGSDDHILILQSDTCLLWEVFAADDSSRSWEGGSGAVWQLDSNEVRPEGYTSADAAGLPILPGLIRYDEVYTEGALEHVTRVTLELIQSAYLRPPASHSDGRAGQDRALPPMGLQLRLESGFDISGYDPIVQVILRGFKKYGLIIADTGGQMFLSGAHDDRWDDDTLRGLKAVKITDFEAVDTGATLVDY